MRHYCPKFVTPLLYFMFYEYFYRIHFVYWYFVNCAWTLFHYSLIAPSFLRVSFSIKMWLFTQKCFSLFHQNLVVYEWTAYDQRWICALTLPGIKATVHYPLVPWFSTWVLWTSRGSVKFIWGLWRQTDQQGVREKIRVCKSRRGSWIMEQQIQST